MGKSIRSKSVLRAKSAKRGGEFSNFVDARNKRLSEKMAKDLAEQKAKLQKQEVEDDKMEEDTKKVSTSGWKNSRKSIYKQSLIKKKKKKTHLKF